MVDFAREAVDINTSIEQSEAIIRNFYDYTTERTIDWAENTATSLGIAEDAAKAFAAELGLIYAGSKMGASSLHDIATETALAAREWAYFNNLNTDDVLNAITGALEGNSRSLRQIGIPLTQAEIMQTKYASSLRKTFSELSAAEKAEATRQAILERTAVAQGALNEENESHTESLYQLRIEIRKIQQLVGDRFFSQLNKSIRSVTEYLQDNEDVVSDVANIIGKLIEFGLKLITVFTKIPASVYPVIIVAGTLLGVLVKVASTIALLSGSLPAAGLALSRFGAMAGGALPTILAFAAAAVALAFIIGKIYDLIYGTKQDPLKDLTNSVAKEVSSIQNSVNNAGGGYRGYATGTNYAESGWAVVGERGPELVRLNGGETVLNATRTASLLRGAPGGSSSTYNDNRTFHVSVDNIELFHKIAKIVEESEMSRIRTRAAGGT